MVYRTGFHAGDISPTQHNSGDFVNMWGFGPTARNPDNLHAHKVAANSIAVNTLICQALCIRDSSGKPVLIISLDLGSISLDTVKEIKKRLIEASKNELHSDSICINVFSHSWSSYNGRYALMAGMTKHGK